MLRECMTFVHFLDKLLAVCFINVCFTVTDLVVAAYSW